MLQFVDDGPTRRARNVFCGKMTGRRSGERHVDELGDHAAAALVSPSAARVGERVVLGVPLGLTYSQEGVRCGFLSPTFPALYKSKR